MKFREPVTEFFFISSFTWLSLRKKTHISPQNTISRKSYLCIFLVCCWYKSIFLFAFKNLVFQLVAGWNFFWAKLIRLSRARRGQDPITTNVVSSNTAQNRCTRYNIMWWSLSPATPVSSNKNDRHDIAEILLKVALNTISLTLLPHVYRRILLESFWW